jgi:hypothetical protein
VAARLDLVPFKETDLLYLVFVTVSLENAAAQRLNLRIRKSIVVIEYGI